MKNRIRQAFQTITPHVHQNVRIHHVQRLHACVNNQGLTFEHLL
jgi:hypothetical protein